MIRKFLAFLLLCFACSFPAQAEDGYRLWLRYERAPPALAKAYAARSTAIVTNSNSPTLRAAAAELVRGVTGITGRPPPQTDSLREGAILIGTPASSRVVASLRLQLAGLGPEGYLLRSLVSGGRHVTVIAANSDVGALYGSFALLRRMQTGQPIAALRVASKPRYALRMLDHWDNLDGFVERGYAGRSLWQWANLPAVREPRYVDYARANASIGINGAVLNNVNADARILRPEYLRKVAALADQLRPWGIRVYLSAKFSAPIELGGLKTADPLDPAVRAWWRAKADELYRYVPDFGGFLIKANSEGQPGPQDYGRTHADGANMLADALAPHGGTVIWRAFVYRSSGDDRARQAYDEFKPLDGKFRSNVVLQVKNGPIDFQPREPFHPLFGQMPHTRVMMEGQITKEYLGFSTHLVFLAPLWKEVLDADTCSRRCGSPVASSLTGMAGVANTGSDRNWSGSDFDQANWYAFGRLAWNPALSSRSIAEEWTRMTWGNDPKVVGTVVPMMLGSREAAVNYMTPLGLAHLMGTNHHYGPAPWVNDLTRPEWNPAYYHRADSAGIGFDRTATGSNAVAQYAPPVARKFADRRQVPERYLLWFHHLPWDYRMRSGRTLWDELVAHYDRGLAQVRRMRASWESLRGAVDSERFTNVEQKLAAQEREARWWRDASIAYFRSVSHRPLPAGVAPPPHPLSYYEALRFSDVPGTPK